MSAQLFALPEPNGKPQQGGWFDAWYETYPKRQKRRHARKMFEREIQTKEDFERLMRNTKLWAERFTRRESIAFVPDPGTFLNRGDWEEPPAAERNGHSRRDEVWGDA